MNIAIKSEMDSRVVLYPLMRSLKSYGSIVVISNNKQLKRLIDDEEEAGFRNIRVIVDEGTTDEILEAYGIAEGDYDFVIQDNVGSLDYHLCIVPLGLSQSIEFDEDIELMLEGDQPDKIKQIQFGRAAVKARSQTDKESKGKSKHQEEYDPAEKFRNKDSDTNKRVEMRIPNVSFPTYQNIEELEATHKFYDLSGQMITAMYDILKEIVLVGKSQFEREVRKKDESSGYYKQRDTTR